MKLLSRFVIAPVLSATLLAAAFACSPGLADTVQPHDDNPAARDARHEGIGFWKAYTPQGFKGEFDNYDPIGLIGGALIKTDCSINWLTRTASSTASRAVPRSFISRTYRRPIFAGKRSL